MSRDLRYLRHIAECIRRVEVNTAEGRAASSEATQRLSEYAKKMLKPPIEVMLGEEER